MKERSKSRMKISVVRGMRSVQNDGKKGKYRLKTAREKNFKRQKMQFLCINELCAQL